MAGLDKFDNRLDTWIPFRREFQEFIEPVEYAVTHGWRKLPNGFRRTEHYAAFGRLEPFGIDGNFHGWMLHKRKDGRHTHKLELNNVGETGKTRIYTDLERVVAIDPRRVEIMRLDCAADIPDVPMNFVKHHMRVVRKRRGANVLEFEDPYFEHIYGRGETMYYGARPNTYRAYDKVAELKWQHKRALQKLAKQTPNSEMSKDLPTFEASYGLKETDVLTRVERVMVGRGIPEQIQTVADLDKLVDFDPFQRVMIFAGLDSLPRREDYTFAQYECGLNLRSMQQAFGIDYLYRHMRLHLGDNMKREWERYQPFFRVEAISGFTREQLYEAYRDGISKQLAA